LVLALIGLTTLAFDLFTSNLVQVLARVVGNLPTKFGVSAIFWGFLFSTYNVV